uniref:Deoxyhypusine synthase n=1 Tax=Eiseniibacteriota bacterium TaxID=2212470 RepID=A0A832MK33_UNCEI
MGRYREADLSKLRVGSVADRPTRVRVEDFARPLDPAAARAVLAALPDQLAARALREVVARVVAARRAGRPVLAMLGGHVVKVGVSPCLVSLMERGAVTHLAMNGAAAIHDVEIARVGRTSEDVEANLHAGTFGMVDETGDFMNDAAAEAARRGEGLGEAWGRALEACAAPHRDVSLLASAWRLGVPATVHVALGTDTIHHHPRCDGAALGACSLRDFRILAATLAEARGAVALNLGSAVLMPEVFLKALAVARNLGADLADLTTVNLDQIQHYRPRVNVVERPTRAAGAKGFALTGHHEILVPLLAAAVLAEL